VEGRDGLYIVGGLVELDPEAQGEGFARGPYPVGEIAIDGQSRPGGGGGG
jgi:hypothetical protein